MISLSVREGLEVGGVRRCVVGVVVVVIALTVGAVPVGAQSRPRNDDFANRIDLGSATSVTTPASTVNAVQGDRNEVFGVPNEPGITGRFVWWTWRAPAKGHVRVFTERANYPSTLWVYTGRPSASPDTISPVYGDAMEFPDFDDSGVEFLARPGEQYQIVLGAMFEEPDLYEGRAVLRLEFVPATNAPPAPTITAVITNTHERKVVVTFSSVRNATSYEIKSWMPYHWTVPPIVQTVPRSPGAVPIADTDFYDVQVRGVTSGGIKGAWSDPVMVERVTTEPLAERTSDTVIEFRWFPPANGAVVSGYRLYLTDLHSGRQRLWRFFDSTDFTFTDAIPGRSYEFEVWAMRDSVRVYQSPTILVEPSPGGHH